MIRWTTPTLGIALCQIALCVSKEGEVVICRQLRWSAPGAVVGIESCTARVTGFVKADFSNLRLRCFGRHLLTVNLQVRIKVDRLEWR